MKFENSSFGKTCTYYKLEAPFGNFFLCEKFIIAELHNGVHFDWPKVKLIAQDIFEFYDEHVKVGYISNRINSYSVDPQAWEKVEAINKNNMIVGSSIVCYNEMTHMNAALEKRFSKVNFRICSSLEEAIEWILNLEAMH